MRRLMQISRFVGAIFMLVLFFYLLQYWYASFRHLAAELPEVVRLMQVRLTIPDNGAQNAQIVIGRDELFQNEGAKSAASDHIRITRDSQGAIGFANIATDRKLYFKYESGLGFLSNRSILEPGDSLRVGPSTYRIVFDQDQPDVISLFRRDGTALNATMLLDLDRRQICYKNSVARLFPESYDWLRNLARPGFLCTLASIGGTVNQSEAGKDIYIADPALPEDSVRIRVIGNLVLAELGRANLVIHCKASGQCVSLGRNIWPLESPRLGKLQTITAGRTLYSVEETEAHLILTPRAGEHWMTSEKSNARRIHAQAELAFFPNERLVNYPLPDTPQYVTEVFGDLTWSAITQGGTAKLYWLLIMVIYWLVPRYRSMPMQGLDRLHAMFIVGFASFLLALLLQYGVGLGINESVILLLTLLYPIRNAMPRWLRYLSEIMLALAPIFSRRFLLALLTFRWLLNLSVPLAKLLLEMLFYGGLFIALMLWVMEQPTLPPLSIYEQTFQANAALIGLNFLAFLLICVIIRLNLLAVIFWTAFSFIIAMGSLTVFQLAFGNDNAAYLPLYRNHIMVMGLIFYLSLVACFVSILDLRTALRSILTIYKSSSHMILVAFASMLLFLLIAIWAFWGTETGIAGVQPSELTKSLLCILFAILAAIALRTRQSPSVHFSPFRAGFPILLYLLFLGAMALAGIKLSDFSPLVIQVINMTFVTCLVLLLSVAVSFPMITAALLLSALIGLVFGWNDTLMNWALVLLCLSGVMLLMATHQPTANEGLTQQSVQKARLPSYGWIQQFKAKRDKIIAFLPAGTDGDERQADAEDHSYDSIWFRWRRQLQMLYRSTGSQAIEIIAIFSIIGIFFAFHYIGSYAQKEDRMLADSVGWKRVPIERLLSWKDIDLDEENRLVRYHDWGNQAVRSRVLIAQSGCGFADLAHKARLLFWSDGLNSWNNNDWQGWLLAEMGKLAVLIAPITQRISSLAGCNGAQSTIQSGAIDPRALAIPAVQDDFVAAFFIHTFGRDSLLYLGVAQATLIFTMLAIGFAAVGRGWREPRDFDIGIVFGLVLAGFAAVMASQFILSWANIFGLLPIVGQPMTFMSLAGSHHLFFAMPGIISVVLILRVLHSGAVGTQARRRGYYAPIRGLLPENAQS